MTTSNAIYLSCEQSASHFERNFNERTLAAYFMSFWAIIAVKTLQMKDDRQENENLKKASVSLAFIICM